jgi:hypothetical protein
MSAEITAVTATTAPLPTTGRATAVGGALVDLLQAQPLLDGGDTAPAQVLSLKQTGAAFELLLQISLGNGRQASVAVASAQPLLPGTQVSVAQPTPGSLALTVQQARGDAVASLTEIDTTKLPVGTLLQGKVMTAQLIQPGVWRSLVTLLNTAQAGATLTLDGPKPLRLGSLLSAQVQGSQQLALVPLSGRLDQLALSQQLSGQQARQGSLNGMLAGLASLLRQPTALPAAARAEAAALLASVPRLADLGDPRLLAQALQGSGAFMEPNLLAGLLPGAAPAPAPDLKSALLRLVAQLTPLLPAASGANPATPQATGSALGQTLPGYVRNALGLLGQVGAKPPTLDFPLPPRLLPGAAGDADIEQVLRLASAAIARLQSHQLTSLEQTGLNDQGRLQTTWQLEIPMRNLQDIVPLQVKLQREDLPEDDPEERRETPREGPARDKLWRLELAFDLASLGPLQVQAQLLHGNLSSELWAERPGTAHLISSQLHDLRARLLDCGLNVTDINCHHGTPPRGPRTQVQHRWVDETA